MSETAAATADPFAELVTKEYLLTHHPDVFTQSRLNYWLRDRDTNGLAESGALVWLSARQLRFHLPSLFKWVRSRNVKPAAIVRPGSRADR